MSVAGLPRPNDVPTLNQLRSTPPEKTLTLDHPHLLLVVVIAGGGGEVVEPSIWSGLSSMPSAATFSSTRATRLVPGIGAMSSPWARSQASATWAGVAPDLGRDGRDLLGAAQIALEVLAGEARVGLAEVGVGELVARADLSR